MRRQMNVLFGFLAFVGSAQAQTYQEGGYKDLQTGLVWSQSQFIETGSSWLTWDLATSRAAAYSVEGLDANGVSTLYEDWRLPTVTEVQQAIRNGVFDVINATFTDPVTGQVHYAYGTSGIWTSVARGTKAYVVILYKDYDANGVLQYYPELSGGTEMWLKGSGTDAFFVRGQAPAKHK